jgi:D-alanyl-D-alanine-carboxypeptidase/D-alanyl-D-alanine-endopeptidase
MRRNATTRSTRARGRARSILILVVTVLSMSAVARPARAAEPDPARTCRADGPAAEALLPTVDPIVQRWLGEHPESNMPGLAIGIVAPVAGQPGASQTVLITCGVTEHGGTVPVVPTTRFEIGSESKLFTALSFADRILAGAIGLDDTVQEHLPAGIVAPEHTCGSSSSTPMSLRDLATHNSGLQDDPANITWHPQHAPQGHHDYTRTLLFDAFTHGYAEPCDALRFDPGTQYAYSNWGFALLGTILADAYRPGETTPPYGQLVDDLVIQPLGLASTEIEPLTPPTDLAHPTCAPNASSPCHWDNDNAFAGAGGLISDITDMSSFVRANLGFDPTIPLWPAIQLTQSPTGIGSACATCMGLGWEITPPGAAPKLSPLPILSKDGGTWGMHSQTYLVPDGCWGITLLSSSNEATSVGNDGVGGDLVKALGPTAAAGPCAAAAPTTTSSTTGVSIAEPSPTTAVAVVAGPRFAG